MKSIQAVIFDMDGLLVDSEPIQFETSKILFRRYGHRFTQKHLREFLGVRLKEELKILKRRWNLTPTVDQMVAERKIIFLQLVRQKLPLSKGARELLQFLQQKDFRIGLGTSAEQWYIDEVMHRFDIRMYFDKIVGADQVQYGKPHPEVYLTVASSLGVAPSLCLVLEDAVHGVAAARAAGMICFAIPSPFIPKTEFSKANQIFPSLIEVRQYLEKRALVQQQRQLKLTNREIQSKA